MMQKNNLPFVKSKLGVQNRHDALQSVFMNSTSASQRPVDAHTSQQVYWFQQLPDDPVGLLVFPGVLVGGLFSDGGGSI